MTIRSKRAASTAIALSLGLGLSACADTGVEPNASLYSVNQPVVERDNYTLDLMAQGDSLPVTEQLRLAQWFEAMDIGYGDRISIDDPAGSTGVREDVAAIASRSGLLLADAAPVTVGYVDPGMVRVVVTRSRAHVPGCPNWGDKYATNLGNNTSPGFGCSVNGNMAAMIADPEHLLEGAKGTGETVVMSSTKAIESYRASAPSGAGGLPAVSSGE